MANVLDPQVSAGGGFTSAIAKNQANQPYDPNPDWVKGYTGLGGKYRGLGLAAARYRHNQAVAAANTPVARIKREQQNNAKDFRANLPGMAGQMTSNLEQSANDQMGANLNAIRGSNSRRGLLYGGLNQGQEQAERARTRGAIAQGRSNINAGLADQANALDIQAIQTGVGIQQTQQAMQNAVYQNAMAKMNADNQAFGGLLQVAAMGAGMYAGGAFGAAGGKAAAGAVA